MQTAFLERHTEDILGAYSCFDRIIIQGALPDIAHADAITQWFFWHDKLTHRAFFRYDTGRCVHYYFYCNIIGAFPSGVHRSIMQLERATNIVFKTPDVLALKHYRKVEHRDGTACFKMASVRKSIFSLPPLAELMDACSRHSSLPLTIRPMT
ncbi:MAG: hypothetical protein PHH26_09575 [Candidatus Thermoplasmatota archaeon]|nr:hypothetical protein [Candidatus Thermoplasmatota archaeon]